MPHKTMYVRQGRQCQFTLTHEAYEVLVQQAQGPGCYGRHLSELLLQERARREERKRYEEALTAAGAGEGRP